MSRLTLLHWNAAEAEERAERLRKAGHEVQAISEGGGEAFRLTRARPPDAYVIDLSRLPSHGRNVAIFLRRQTATRYVPLVFVDGAPEKVERVRREIPDAVYTDWPRVRGSITRAIKRPPADPVVPANPHFGTGTPLARKLDVKAGSVLVLVDAPAGFETTLGQLPDGVTVRRGARGRADLAILFAGSQAAVGRRFAAAAKVVPDDKALWIAWPKKASGVASDLTQVVVRRLAEERGWVDFKICSIDDTWSGLKFTRRAGTKTKER